MPSREPSGGKYYIVKDDVYLCWNLMWKEGSLRTLISQWPTREDARKAKKRKEGGK